MTTHDPTGPQTVPDPGPARRIRIIAFAAYLLFAGWFVLQRDWTSLGGLTCSSLVVMIAFLWLEEIAFKLLGPAPLVKPWKLGVRAIGRYVLIAALVAIFGVRFNIISVLLGTSILVIGIMGETVYALVTSDDEGVGR